MDGMVNNPHDENARPYQSTLFLVFQICSTSRWLDSARPEAFRRALAKRGIPAGMPSAYWVRLLQSAHLLNHNRPPRPTLLTEEWLARPAENQFADLQDAWMRLPRQRRRRELRWRVLKRLEKGQNIQDWSPTYRREARSLQALGLAHFDNDAGGPAASWRIDHGVLHIAEPVDYALLWALEEFLQPFKPGHYAFGLSSLRQASERGDPRRLVETLEKGLGEPLPGELAALILGQPVIQVLSGMVLEFSDPRELAQMRRTPALRREMERMLSPRHVLLEHGMISQVMRKLRRRGLVVDRAGGLQEQVGGAHSVPITAGECAEVLALARVVEGLKLPASLPEELETRLKQSLPEALLAASRRKADRVLEQFLPKWIPGPPDDTPPRPAEDLIETLEGCIRREEALNVIYQVPGCSPERRRVTPLMIEQRGLRFYLVAYCHNRRGNRLFRLDRLELG